VYHVGGQQTGFSVRELDQAHGQVRGGRAALPATPEYEVYRNVLSDEG